MGIVGVLLRKLRSKILFEPTAFGWVIEGKLAASGSLSSPDQVRWVARKGVNGILSLTETPIPKEWVVGTDIISSKHLPIRDHASPNIDELDEATKYIDSELRSGKVMLVHCLAGKGRTGCVLAAYLMKKEGMSADQAIRLVRTKRPGSIEFGQENALREFKARLTSVSR